MQAPRKAHAGIFGKLNSDLLEHKDTVRGLLSPESPISRIVFTGHSLGGGCALLMHLMAFLLKGEDVWKDVALRSVAFAAPMPFQVLDIPDTPPRDQDGTLRFSQEDLDKERALHEEISKHFGEASTNWVFDKDVVPRLPGNVDYAVEALKRVASSFLQSNWDIVGGGGSLYVPISQ